MKFKGFIFTITAMVASSGIMAQANLLNAKTPDAVGVRTAEQIAEDNDYPLEYGYVNDRDVLWSKTVWEKIDLDERINFPYYYPTDTVDIAADRRSLYDVLLKNIKNGRIENVYVDSYFTEKRTYDDIKATLRKVDTLDLGYEQLNAGETISPEYINIRDLTAADIEEIRIKGVWYFDKKQGEMKYRLLGIAPVAPDVNFIDDESNYDLVELFWVWFPSVRDILHESKVFNNRNTSMPLTYDHLLNSRRFNGLIYKEDNVYGDRDIVEYIQENALMQLLESDRIRTRIHDFEQDMWTY
ncbi:gliding motility protein GldN [Sungkyunkwania multivorans]|uniref:Gliding motility protein GldN n=1 Tax=Sungkyunkwania multivorans TaxID=1173618 RepID=A0ABW3D460_9FLAO